MNLSTNMPRILSFFFLATFITVAKATEVTLCEVTSDIDSEKSLIVYEADSDARAITHMFKDRYVNGKRVERDELKIEDLLGSGIVLAKKDAIVAVRMYSHNFDLEQGGILFLDTLYSGVSGERREYVFEVVKNANGFGMTFKKIDFKRMHFIARRSPILGVIGIEKVNFLK